MPRVRYPLALLAVVTTMLALAPAASAKSCRIGDDRSYGTTYVTQISASGTSCRSARKLVRAFHACRPGAKGRCGRTKGYSCSESRDTGFASYDSRVTCRKGGNTVKHRYTQNL